MCTFIFFWLMLDTKIKQPLTDQQILMLKIKYMIESEETQNLKNYFVDSVEDTLGYNDEPLKTIADNLFYQFTDTYQHTHCMYITDGILDRTYVKLSAHVLVGEPPINNMSYQLAYGMIQIKALDNDRSVRVLLNKVNKQTCLAVCFTDCIWDSKEPHRLKQAIPNTAIPIVMDLIHCPSAVYAIQEFLVHGDFPKSRSPNYEPFKYIH